MFTEVSGQDQQVGKLPTLINNFINDPSAESYSSLAEFSSDFQKLDQTSMEAILGAVNGVLIKDNKNSYAWLVLGKLVSQQNEVLFSTEYQKQQEQFVEYHNKILSENIRKQLSSHLEGLNIYCYGKA